MDLLEAATDAIDDLIPSLIAGHQAVTNTLTPVDPRTA
jgi:hypothetical protein